MGKQDIRCPKCGTKKVKKLRHVYQCQICNCTWNKHKIVSKEQSVGYNPTPRLSRHSMFRKRKSDKQRDRRR